jgi:hypothetical protein
MTSSQAGLLAINVIGGVLVLGSYVYGIVAHPGQGDLLWGGVPLTTRPVYTFSMLLSAVGYFLFLYHAIFKMVPVEVRLPLGLPFGAFHAAFILILLPSALWMSATFAWAQSPTLLAWVQVRGVLAIVGLGSLFLAFLLAGLRWTAPSQFWWPSLAGALIFAFHTVVLDALIWPALFRR